MPISLRNAIGTDKFRGSADALIQDVELQIDGAEPGSPVTARSGASETTGVADSQGVATLVLSVPRPADIRSTSRNLTIEAAAGDETLSVSVPVEVGEPGWTVFLAPHFHYDPVWWSTQAAFVSEWEKLPVAVSSRGVPGQLDVFELMRSHLDRARLDPDYKFVVAELDYLKPWWSAHPQERQLFRDLVREGRIELAGGTYNEPSTTLISAESTIRNAVYGAGFQRDVLGGDPTMAWQLDVFGHDPQFPGLMAAAGLTRTSWARGPFHEWGPMHAAGGRPMSADPVGMQFEAEFEWMSPNGAGLLTSYMPAHYSAGWWMDDAPSLGAAEEEIYRLFHHLRSSAATLNVLIPVGTDHIRPNRWVTDIHRHWAEEYVWPRIIVATPDEYFTAVERDLAAAARPVTTQTRDMNPVFGGTNTSFADTKQAHRAAENLLADAEKFASFAATLGLARYPHERLDYAWRQLSFASHHDAITGSESDQVYVDLLGSWRDAWTTAAQLHADAATALSGVSEKPGKPESITVFNAISSDRSDVVSVSVMSPVHDLRDSQGMPIATAVSGSDDAGWLLSFVAQDVPATGFASYAVGDAETDNTWKPIGGNRIANEHYSLESDTGKGGTVSSLVELASGRELITPGRFGNEILIFAEYANHPKFGELGPWYIMSKGDAVLRSSAAVDVTVCALRSPVGERIEVTGRLGDLEFRHVITLWKGIDRVDCSLHLNNFTGADQLVRVAWPVDVAGALPVADVAGAVVGRGFAHPLVDTAEFPWSLDAPCHQWFGLSSPARLRVNDGNREHVQSIGVAEIVSRTLDESADLGRSLAIALVACGVTSTNSIVTTPRYGDLDNDSNLPDIRIAIGDVSTNSFIREVLEGAHESFTDQVAQLASTGGAVLVPAARSTRSAFTPGATVVGANDLPVLIITGDVHAAVQSLVDDLHDATIELSQSLDHIDSQAHDGHSVALVNRGTPGYAVDTDGTLYLSLMRSSTGWPSGVWIDPPVRATPDGTAFQLQHWTHQFDYSVVSAEGDWRQAGFAMHGQAINHPLTAIVGSGPARDRSLLRVEPQGVVFASAVKLAGNPLASGAPVDEKSSALTLRVFESSGVSSEVRASFDQSVVAARESDLLELTAGSDALRDSALQTNIGGFDTKTFRVDLEAASPACDRDGTTTQFSRYWLHNSGAAPVGNQPFSVGIRSTRGATDNNRQLAVTVAREVSANVIAGELRVTVSGSARLIGAGGYDLSTEQEYVVIECEVQLDDSEGDGLFAVVASFDYAGSTVFDAIVVDPRLAEPLSSIALAPLVTASWQSPSLELTTSQTRVHQLALVNHSNFDVQGEVQLLSPWGSWTWLSNWKRSFTLQARESQNFDFTFTPPSGTPTGTTWALAKVTWFGSVSYTETLPILVFG